MIFGLLKDSKTGEYRTVATPTEIAVLTGDGHQCLVQRGAGAGAGFSDQAYVDAGAELGGHRGGGLPPGRSGGQGQGD